MSVSITQMRLAMRLDTYQRDYASKNVKEDNLHGQEWDELWQVAVLARTNNDLTPEIVDDVRVALHKL